MCMPEIKACFLRRISVASNAIQTIDNEMIHLIIYCLNCIRRDWNATYKTGLKPVFFCLNLISSTWFQPKAQGQREKVASRENIC